MSEDELKELLVKLEPLAGFAGVKADLNQVQEALAKLRAAAAVTPETVKPKEAHTMERKVHDRWAKKKKQLESNRVALDKAIADEAAATAARKAMEEARVALQQEVDVLAEELASWVLHPPVWRISDRI